MNFCTNMMNYILYETTTSIKYSSLDFTILKTEILRDATVHLFI